MLKWNAPNSTNTANPEKYQNITSDNLLIPPARGYEVLSEYDFVYEGSFDASQKFTGKGKLKDSCGEYLGDFN